MAEQYRDRSPEHYEETVAPQNPPNSVLRPEVRRGAWWLYVFPIIVVCIVAGIALLYWVSRDSAPEERIQPVGTAGERQEGGNPNRQPATTADEIKFRGGQDRAVDQNQDRR